MLVDERRTELLNQIERAGFASIQSLCDHTGASESTIRRDLEHLDGIGQVRRTRGGAAYIGESLTAFEDRTGRASSEKLGVARAAAELIESGETVLLDGGTTTYEVARRLAADPSKPLQVVTNSLPIVNLLVNQPHIELLTIGGYLYPKTGVALGPVAVATLKNLHVRRLIMSVGGITELGLFNSNALLVETERQMTASAEEVVVVTDAGKLGHSALSHLCGLEEVDRMVVDAAITPEWREILNDAGVELIVADGAAK